MLAAVAVMLSGEEKANWVLAQRADLLPLLVRL